MNLSFFSYCFLPFIIDFIFAATTPVTSVIAETFSYCWDVDDVIPTTGLTELDDLRSPTAFTYADVLTVYNCSLITYTPTDTEIVPWVYYTTWFTAFVSGVDYPAQNSIAPGPDAPQFTITTTATVYEYYTFPGLTVTSLTRGESIMLNWAVQWVTDNSTTYTTGYFDVFVPTNAITLTTTTITSTSSPPFTSSTSPPKVSSTVSPATSSSSVNAGAIAGGAIGGVVVLGAIFAIVWYMIRTHRREPPVSPNVEVAHGKGESEAPQPPTLRYLDVYDDMPSAKTAGVRY